MQAKNVIFWALRIIAAAILLQTLYFKFTGHPESVALFTKLGVEPWGRIGTGIIELVTGILLLMPATVFVGAFMGMGLMAGAILSHLTVLGIESKGDGGQLFTLAIIELVLCAILALLYKHQGQALLARFIKTNKSSSNHQVI
jgi:putative oxidoreductase